MLTSWEASTPRRSQGVLVLPTSQHCRGVCGGSPSATPMQIWREGRQVHRGEAEVYLPFLRVKFAPSRWSPTPIPLNLMLVHFRLHLCSGYTDQYHSCKRSRVQWSLNRMEFWHLRLTLVQQCWFHQLPEWCLSHLNSCLSPHFFHYWQLQLPQTPPQILAPSRWFSTHQKLAQPFHPTLLITSHCFQMCRWGPRLISDLSSMERSEWKPWTEKETLFWEQQNSYSSKWVESDHMSFHKIYSLLKTSL